MKNLPYSLIALLVLTLSVHAKDTTPIYIAPASVDWKALLPAPPANGSPETQREIDLLLEKQKSRTDAEVARAKSEAHPNISFFNEVLGPWFNAKDAPQTMAFLKKVDSDAYPVVEAAKSYYHRPRPPFQDKRIQAAVEIPKNASYPSGHAEFGELYALILAELAPDLKDAIAARGDQIGDDRVMAGVHFPSDVAAGRMLGQALFAKFMASPAFQADLAKAKAEVAAARSKQH